MAPIVPDARRIKSFPSAEAFAAWMRANHDTQPEIWLKVHKKDCGLPTVSVGEALDIALCFGWIDSTRKSFDERSFLQRYSPRGAKSIWSQINRESVARLTAEGCMTPHGQRQVDAAKADGRWDAAYAPMRSLSAETMPEDLRAAIDANPRARQTFATLGRQNLFALSFRTGKMKTAAGRAKKIAELVEMLARGETIHPERPRTWGSSAPAAERPPVKRPAAKRSAAKRSASKRSASNRPAGNRSARKR
jgi:uncharacterized protein YdeI (YjbR/CyaY-like superfamily)